MENYVNHVTYSGNTERYISNQSSVATAVLFPVGPELTQMSHIFVMLAQIMVGVCKTAPNCMLG